jgi:chaperonin GroES
MHTFQNDRVHIDQRPQSVTVTPLGSGIVVQRDEAQDKIGSIYIPETNQTRPVVGTVKAVGPEVREVKVGDRIYYAVRGRKEVTLGGVYHQIIVEADVFGVEE